MTDTPLTATPFTPEEMVYIEAMATVPGYLVSGRRALATIATLTTRAEQAEANLKEKLDELAATRDDLHEWQARVAELTAVIEGWQKAAMAGAAHICCEECQSECDHDSGFGFDDDVYTGRAAMEGQRD